MLVLQVADGRADEVGTVGVQTFLHEQVNFAKIHSRHIDGYFFSVWHFSCSLPSTWMVYRWYSDYIHKYSGCQGKSASTQAYNLKKINPA
jgi:hypothetical protein